MAWLLSAFFWTYALAQVPSGFLSDYYGPRRMLTLYVLLWSLLTGLFGLATEFVVLLLLRFAFGLAQAGAYPTSAVLVARWVPLAARGTASGLIALGGRIGGYLAQTMTAELIVLFGMVFVSGWRPVIVLYGLAGLVVAGLFWSLTHDSPAQHPLCNKAEAMLIREGQPPETPSLVRRIGRAPLGVLIRSGSMWLMCVAQIGTNFGWVFLVTWLPRYLDEAHHVPFAERGRLAGIPILAGWAGMLAGGWATDRLARGLGARWGRAVPIAASRFLAFGAYVVCWLWFDLDVAIMAFAVVAFSTDFGAPAVWAFTVDVGGRHVGSVLGWGNMWGNLGAAVSPLLLNWVHGQHGWDGVFLACAAAFLISGVCALGINAAVPLVAEEGQTG